MTKSLTGTPLIKPIALPALKGLNFKGLGFTRSRSAPPTPRDEKQHVVQEKGDNTPATVPEGSLPDETVYNDDDDKLSDGEVDVADIPRHTSPEILAPSPAMPHVVTDHDATFAPTGVARIRHSNVTPLRAPVPIAATSLTPLANSSLAAPVVTSRSSSPAPSLEQAILAERMRRAAAGPSSTPVPKGARFKSSPLTGDRVGVVVAERVKRSMWEGDGPGRTTSEKEKEGPDVY